MVANKLDISGNFMSATNFAAVAPSDSVDLTSRARALWIGGAGNLTIRCPDTQADITFTGVPAGALLPVQTDRVKATATTATSIIALF